MDIEPFYWKTPTVVDKKKLKKYIQIKNIPI